MIKGFIRYLKQWDNPGKKAIVAAGFTLGIWRRHQRLYDGNVVIGLTLLSFLSFLISGLLFGYANELKNKGAKKSIRMVFDLLAVLFCVLGVFGHYIWNIK